MIKEASKIYRPGDLSLTTYLPRSNKTKPDMTCKNHRLQGKRPAPLGLRTRGWAFSREKGDAGE